MIKISRFVLPRAAPFFSISALIKPTKPHYHHPNPPSLAHIVGSTSICRTHLAYCTTCEEGKTVKSSPVNGDGFPGNLRREKMPEHVAFILDGNRRWAEHRGLSTQLGHDAGLHSLVEIMGLCSKWSIKVATFFLFSCENWSRPKEEIDFVMGRFEKMLVDELENFKGQGIRISSIGDISKIPNSLQEILERTKEATQNNTKTHVIFAISYSGKNDFVQACQSLATKVRDGLIDPKEITESIIERELETKITANPSPDLLIRTSGEVRISNFLLWQLAYSELYFTNTLWPDFGEPEFVVALQSFQNRGRRFGGR